MSTDGPPEIVADLVDGGAIAVCPRCGLHGLLDEDQLRGEVSIDCPECSYHETHDLREEDAA